jgi:hypothetical protein
MSKLRYFPNSSFRFSTFVTKKKNPHYFLTLIFCSVKIEAVRYIFESETEELKQFVSLRKKNFFLLSDSLRSRSWGVLAKKFRFGLLKKMFTSLCYKRLNSLR